MNEYCSLGHMTRVDLYGTPHYIMPHHGVLRNHSTSTVQWIINNDFYVDDMITGSDSIEHILRLCHKTKKVLESGCFPLRKWTFNFNANDCNLNNININQNNIDLSLGENVNCRTLGLGWNNFTDELYYHTQFKGDNKKNY